MKTVADLFAGVGGCRLAFEKAGFKTAFSHDIDKHCQATYDLNFKKCPMTLGDIRSLNATDVPDFDILLAGFPCQPFSIAGYRDGFGDRKGRGDIFFEILRILEAKSPVGFMLENVKNLKSHNNGKTFQIMTDALDSVGYELEADILNTMEYGRIPQNRERVYMVGFRKNSKILRKFRFPTKTKLNRSTVDLLIPANEIGGHYYYEDRPLWKHIGGCKFETGRVYQWRRTYLRTNKKDVFPTLTANMGGGVVIMSP